MTNKLELAKTAINLIAGAGASKVAHDIIKNNTTTETTADAAKVFAGSLVFGSMAAEAASTHVSAKIDSIVAWNANRKAKNIPEVPES